MAEERAKELAAQASEEESGKNLEERGKRKEEGE
jgi:hypothetical protein